MGKKEKGNDEISILTEASFIFPRSSKDLQKDFADLRLGISLEWMSLSWMKLSVQVVVPNRLYQKEITQYRQSCDKVCHVKKKVLSVSLPCYVIDFKNSTIASELR